MLTLQFKFTAALLFTSFAAIALTGGLAHWLEHRKFNELAMEQAFEGFQADVAAYIGHYGSWEQARAVERFGQFQRRRRALLGQGITQTDTLIPGVAAQDNSIPPPALDEAGRPPFRFVLLSPQGRIWMGGDRYPVGATVPPEVIQQAKPITLHNATVALAIPTGEPNLSDIDVGYLEAMNMALIYAGIVAGFLALLLGIYFSRNLTRPLKHLTEVIRTMDIGNIYQKLAVESTDEIGTLVENFNKMSSKLAVAYQRLEDSNETIREQSVRLKQLAIRDDLTRLHNRRYFNEEAAKLFAHSKRHSHPLVFVICDIDHFKQINDNFSHATGDDVLRQVADIFQDNTRQNDLVARYGGEEFVIAFPETPLETAAMLCERLRERIENHPWQVIQPDLNVTISMGLDADMERESFEQMLAAADKKLYEAKEAGRNRVCY